MDEKARSDIESANRAALWIVEEVTMLHRDSASLSGFLVGHLRDAGLLADGVNQEKMTEYIEKRNRGHYDRKPPALEG